MPGPLFWFFALLALLTLATAARFVLLPAERTLAVLRPLCAATAFASLAASLAGMANAMVAMGRWIDGAPEHGGSVAFWRATLNGLAEAPIALLLGCATLAVAWLLVAAGTHRQP